MKAFDTLSQKNGLKTTQSVLNKQQSGVDATQKANPQQPTFTMSQLNAMKTDIDKQNAAVPKDETPAMKAAREKTVATQQAVAKGVDVDQGVASDEDDSPTVPIVKKETPEQPEHPKQMSYSDMFKAIYGNDKEETPEQKAKRERREKAKVRIAAIGDGLRALSNMYFATKGAKVVHDPNSDMTPVMLKRKQMLEQQREKNKSAWLNGYLKAQALDEEARKNNNTLAEQIRYHDQLAKNRDRVGDQKDRTLDQKDRQLDLTKYKYDTEADYKKLYLAIKKAESDGRISHWQAMEAIARMNAESGRIRANKTGSSRSGSYSGEIDEYMDLMDQDPQGMKDAEKEVRKMGMSVKTAAGRKAQKIAYKKKHGGSKGAQASGGNKGGSSSSTGGKKSTGVKW